MAGPDRVPQIWKLETGSDLDTLPREFGKFELGSDEYSLGLALQQTAPYLRTGDPLPASFTVPIVREHPQASPRHIPPTARLAFTLANSAPENVVYPSTAPLWGLGSQPPPRGRGRAAGSPALRAGLPPFQRQRPEAVHGTLDSITVQIQHVGVGLGRLRILVPQQFLNRADVGACDE